MKAFLSHSSNDKDYIDLVVKELGRQFCVYDKLSFRSGIEFKESIISGLNDSSVFVLFATASSLDSIWVKFELEEAATRAIQKQIKRILVLIIEDSLSLDKLPDWLKRAKVIPGRSPRHAAREIRSHVNDTLRSHIQPLFIGRSSQLSEAESLILARADGTPQNSLILVGLPQSGRRALARKIASNIIGSSTSVEISIEHGDDLHDVVFKLASEIESYSNIEELSAIQKSINDLPNDRAAEAACQYLKTITESGSVTIITDAGGLIDENGTFNRGIEPLLKKTKDHKEVFTFWITSRKPANSEVLTSASIRIPGLNPKEMAQLMRAICLRDGIKIPPSEMAKLIDHLGGYPPSCYFAGQLIKNYGAAAILANTAGLIEYRVEVLLKYITKHALSDAENSILRLLANHSPLPLAVIGGFLKFTPETISPHLTKLIDYSMITPDTAGL